MSWYQQCNDFASKALEAHLFSSDFVFYFVANKINLVANVHVERDHLIQSRAAL